MNLLLFLCISSWELTVGVNYPNLTPLPFLFCLQTICQKTPKDSAQYEQCKKALQAVSKVRGYC